MRYQVVAREAKKEGEIPVEVKVGDPEKYERDAETHAQTLRDMFKKMGRPEVEIVVVDVE